MKTVISRNFYLLFHNENPFIPNCNSRNYFNQDIPAKNIKVYVDFFSILKANLKINKIYISLDELNYTQLKELSKFIKPPI